MGIEGDTERTLVRITAYASGRREAIVLHAPTQVTEIYVPGRSDPAGHHLVIDGETYRLEATVGLHP